MPDEHACWTPLSRQSSRPPSPERRVPSPGAYNSQVRLVSSAPTRIDLAGGTIDIWPLYIFHEAASTLNAAISLRAHADIESRTDGRVVLRSVDGSREVSAARWSELDGSGDLVLVAL